MLSSIVGQKWGLGEIWLAQQDSFALCGGFADRLGTHNLKKKKKTTLKNILNEILEWEWVKTLIFLK